MTHEEHADDAPETPPEEAPKKTKSKKERVLHTRVPAVLEQELKRLAQSWRVPVSNVVRTILEDAVETVDIVGRRAEGELRGAAERLAVERRRLRKMGGRPAQDAPDSSEDEAPRGGEPDSDPLEGALGFTPLVLASEARCARTGRTLAAGEEAYLVLFPEPGRKAFVASDALPKNGEEKS
ncbi:MAG: hypothetical protein GXP55_12455 [Deltaproteobacteria bacterium]|nr:hypothetical protein [Deltaproteobacteria bacterium]